MNSIRDFFSTSLRRKMILAFCLPTLLLFLVNAFLFVSTNEMLKSLDDVYASNQSLNEINDTLSKVQRSMEGYLNTKTSDVLEEYFTNEQDFRNQINNLSDNLVDDEISIMERNIKRMSVTYLEVTSAAVEAKRGGNVVKYKKLYAESTRLYGYISNNIYSLNDMLFVNNSSSFTSMISALSSLEAINIFTLIIIGAANMIFVVLITSTITQPLITLSNNANIVSQGNFDVSILPPRSRDEIGVVTKAFNTMVVSLKEYIEKLTESMEVERQMKENELKMETHLKDAQLKYLQAQINPHFLFNTLNAGAQLAMMEGAENTNIYLQHVADFFRYNIKKNHDVVTLAEEIALVETYIYILNVRFSGDIHFSKEIDEACLEKKVPSMILQPIVENSVNYGIRNIDWTGKIKLKVYQIDEQVCVSISDNGIGMEQEAIDALLSGQYHEKADASDSNGVGIGNVINRLNLFYGQNDILDMISEGKDKGTETILYLPKQD